MSEPNLSSNLEYLMKLHGDLSISELARQVQLPQPTLHHILNGVTKKPRKQALESLSKFFSVSVAQLTGALPLTSVIPDSIKNSLKISTIPIIEWDMLTEWPLSNKENIELKEIIFDQGLAPHSFALVMSDESMEPIFPKGAILIFDYRKIPRDRDFVIVCLEGNTVIFNRLFLDGAEFYIKQNQDDGNAKLLKLKLPDDKIIGALVEFRFQF